MRHACLCALLATIVVAACTTPPTAEPTRVLSFGKPFVPQPPFQAEPTQHQSFTSTHRLEAGTRLRVVSFTLASDERLRVQRCGQDCATAKLVASWGKADFDRSPTQEYTLAESGDYYLWLRSETPDGEVGSVQARASTFDRDNGVQRFASGAVVFLAVDGTGVAESYPDDPVRIGSGAVPDPKSSLAKLGSSAILDKARHGIKQLLIVELEDGAGVQNIVASLRGTGIESSGDVTERHAYLAVASEAQLRALQAAPWVRMLYENQRVIAN